MPSVVRLIQRGGALGALVLVASCTMHWHASPGGAESLSESERVAHVLSRLTFGPRPGDAERVTAMGVDRWVERQLRPESISDSALDSVLARNPAWNGATDVVASIPPLPASIARTPLAQLQNDSAARAILNEQRLRLMAITQLNDRFITGKIAHAQLGEQQLLEVMCEFWENHFSVFSGKMPATGALVVWDRGVLRPHALGKFRELLGATAHSPAMLYYLDNHLSTKRGLNENYARELMELHTLGVDGGYTQHDVQEVARALTGWTFTRGSDSTVFQFRRDQHDTGTKVVLGHTLASGRGIEDGEEVLDLLARHPSTAHHIALKLARRLVSDEPPPALVDRAAATFTRTDGDIAQVVRTIVTSREFFSRAAMRAKVKTPFQFVVSLRRALGAPADTTPATARMIAQLGQPTFGRQTPEGWPEKGSAWMNPGAVFSRVKFSNAVVDNGAARAMLAHTPEWPNLSPERQVDALVKDIFGGSIESATREAMLATLATSEAKDPQVRMRDVLVVALGSPEFQRR